MRSTIGLVGATSLVIGNMVGAGIYFLPVSLASYGILSIAGWIITSFGAVMLALMFCRLARRNPKVGGPYAYARDAFGNLTGFQMAWGYWACTWIGNAALAVTAVSYLSVFFDVLARDRMLACLTGIGLVWLATAINAMSVRKASFFQIILTILKLSPLVAVGMVGVFFFESTNLTPLAEHNDHIFASINQAALFTLFAFLGLESATIPAQHVDKPQTTIPRATVIGTLLSAVIYIVITVSVIGVIGPATLAQSKAPVADAARIIFGDWAAPFAACGAIISAFGCLIGWVMLQGQVPYAIARDGLFPRAFAQLSRKGMPVVGMSISSVLITLLMFMNYFESLADQFTALISLSTFCMLVPYGFCAMADIMSRYKESPTRNSRFYGSLLLPTGALAFSLWLMVGSGAESAIFGAVYFALGFLVYFIQISRRRLKNGEVVVPADQQGLSS